MGLGHLSIRKESGQISTVYIVVLCVLEFVLFPRRISPYGYDNSDNLDEELAPGVDAKKGDLWILACPRTGLP